MFFDPTMAARKMITEDIFITIKCSINNKEIHSEDTQL
jgi:hypothetical protein